MVSNVSFTVRATFTISDILMDFEDIIKKSTLTHPYINQSFSKWVITLLYQNLHINIDFNSSLLIDEQLVCDIAKIDPGLQSLLLETVKLPQHFFQGTASIFVSSIVNIRISDLGTLILEFKEA